MDERRPNASRLLLVDLAERVDRHQQEVNWVKTPIARKWVGAVMFQRHPQLLSDGTL